MLKKQLNQESAESYRSSITQYSIKLLILILSGCVLFAFGLDLLGLPVSIWTVGPLMLGLICFFIFFFRVQSISIGKNNEAKWNWWEFTLFVIIILGIVAYLYRLELPHYLPVGTSVDAVHQYGLADYIRQSKHLPLRAYEWQANLQDGLAYPPAFVLLVALVSEVLAVDPIYIMYSLTAFFAAITIGTVFAIISFLLERKPWRYPVAGLTAGLSLVPFGYTFGSFTSQNYFAQILGQAFLVICLYVLLLWRKSGQPQLLVLLALTLATLLISYPTWVLVPSATFALTTISCKELNWRARIINLCGVLIPVGFVAWMFLKDRLGTGLGTVANEGDVLLPDLSRYSYPVLALALFGLEMALLISKSLFRIVAVFSGLLVLEGAGIWILKSKFELGSYYSYYKLFYPAVFIIVILAAIGMDYLLECSSIFIKKYLVKKPDLITSSYSGSKRILSILVGTGLFGIFLIGTWLNHPEPDRPYAVITNDTFKVATWMRHNLKIEEYSVAYNLPPGTPAYWLQVGIFKQPRGVHTNDLLTQQPITFENWFYASDTPTYLVTDHVDRIKLDERVKVLYRSGQTAVITKSPGGNYSQQQDQNHLAIQYNAKMTQNLLEIRAEATMSDDPTHWVKIGLEIARLETGNQLSPVWKAMLPVEEGRLKTQYLGLSVNLLSLEVKEFYSNNRFPPVPQVGSALPRGRYIANIVLQKEDNTVEQRKLLEFTYTDSGDFELDFAGGSMSGQFVFENLPLKPVSEITQNMLTLEQEQITLVGLNVPSIGQPGQMIQTGLLFQLTTPLVHNYVLEAALLNQDGQIASSIQFIPQNGLYPTWMWPVAKQSYLEPELKLPDKPGKYQLVLSLLDPSTGKRSDLVGLNTFIKVDASSK